MSPAKIQKLITRLEGQATTLAYESLPSITRLRELLDADITPAQARLIYNEIYFLWKDAVRRGRKRKEEGVDGKRIVL